MAWFCSPLMASNWGVLGSGSSGHVERSPTTDPPNAALRNRNMNHVTFAGLVPALDFEFTHPRPVLAGHHEVHDPRRLHQIAGRIACHGPPTKWSDFTWPPPHRP